MALDLQADTPAPATQAPHPPVHHTWLYRRGVLPILALLRMGATPRSLAWSIAIGLLIGLNPLLGTTTILCLAASTCLRLNPVAAQIANHSVFPLELALVVPFIRLGTRLFRTAPMPLSPGLFLHAARTSPLALTRQLWTWELHAFLVWLAIAVLGAPIIALALTPAPPPPAPPHPAPPVPHPPLVPCLRGPLIKWPSIGPHSGPANEAQQIQLGF